MKHFFLRTCTLQFILLLYAATALASGRVLMFSPVRLVLDDSHRSGLVKVINPTEQATPYRISLVTLRRTDTGSLIEPEEETPLEQLSRKLVRFSPRRATIQPNTRQVIKIMSRKPRDLPPGEYITRLKVTPQPEQENTPTVANTRGRSQFSIDMIVGATIPIIIQHEILPGTITPKSLRMVDTTQGDSGKAIEVLLERTGEGSGFGDLLLFPLDPQTGKKGGLIGRARGIAVYQPEQEHRSLVLLEKERLKNLTPGPILVEFHPNLPSQVGREKKSEKQIIARVLSL